MSEKHNPENDIPEADAALFEEETPADSADAVILSPQGEGSPAESGPAEEEAPAAGGAPSDEGAVEDGSPSETEGGIPADSADAVILSERSESKDLTSPSVILSEAKDPTPQAESLPEEGDSSGEALGMTDPAPAPADPDPAPAADAVILSPQGEGSPAESSRAEEEGDSSGEALGMTDPDPAPADPDPAPKEKKSIIRRIIGIVGYTVVIALMLLVAFILFSNMSGKVTFIFGRTAMWVKTESMAPVIPERSYILVRKAAAPEVAVGDVIVFKSDDPAIAGSYNTHRVVEIVGGGAEFVTKGDNNAVADQYTAKAANVLGIYEKNLPIMTSFGRVLSTTQGIMITFTMIFVIFLIIYVPDMTRAAKKKQDEADRIEQARVDALVALEVEKLKAEAAAKAAAEAASAETREDAE